MSVILITTLFYKALISQGEIWCWSLLGLKGLKKTDLNEWTFDIIIFRRNWKQYNDSGLGDKDDVLIVVPDPRGWSGE